MAKRYTSWKELKGAVDDDIKKAMEEDVGPMMVDILREHIYSDVYGVYTPKTGAWVGGTTYQRRGQLADKVQAFYSWGSMPTASAFYIPKTKNVVWVTSTETASPAIRGGASFHNRRPGVFLQMMENGDMGFLTMKQTEAGNTFPRYPLTNAGEDIRRNSEMIKRALDHAFKT